MILTPIDIKPTFPFDENRIARRKREAVFGAPRLMLLRFSGWLGNFIRLLRLEATESIAKAFIAKWEQADRELTLNVLRELIEESNYEQDTAIRGMITSLKATGKVQYAIALGKFLLLKQNIERAMHRDETLTEQKKKLEGVVDSICHEVCAEIYHLSILEDRLADTLTSRDPDQLSQVTATTRDGHTNILRAYATLAETAERLPMLLRPGRSERHDEREAAELDRLLEVLKSENDLAKRVDDRIREELPKID